MYLQQLMRAMGPLKVKLVHIGQEGACALQCLKDLVVGVRARNEWIRYLNERSASKRGRGGDWVLSKRAWRKAVAVMSGGQQWDRGLLTLDLASTRTVQVQRGYIDDGTCLLCGKEAEDRAHVLMRCDKTKQDVRQVCASTQKVVDDMGGDTELADIY